MDQVPENYISEGQDLVSVFSKASIPPLFFSFSLMVFYHLTSERERKYEFPLSPQQISILRCKNSQLIRDHSELQLSCYGCILWERN